MISHLKHLKSRLLILVLITVGFLLFGVLIEMAAEPEIVDGYFIPQRSCLGNRQVLYYVFIGLPLLLFLGISDVIYLLIIKKLTINKFIINLFLIAGR